MKMVYLLWHTHVISEDREDSKLIGVYETAEAAKQAQARVAGQAGFRKQPEGFEIVEYKLGEDHWREGYATMLGDREIEDV